MDELFSCRNCIHNPLQSINIGSGAGYCLQHHSVIPEPQRTTCKYLHRKDLPLHLVSDGVREHAEDFKLFPAMASLDHKKAVSVSRDAPVPGNAMEKAMRWWRLGSSDYSWRLASLCSGIDGIRSLAYACLVRRHLAVFGGRSAAMLHAIAALIDIMPDKPVFSSYTINLEDENEALWDVVFVRIAALQEFGWHIGDESLLYACDPFREIMAEFNWPPVEKKLKIQVKQWHRILRDNMDEKRLDDPLYHWPFGW